MKTGDNTWLTDQGTGTGPVSLGPSGFIYVSLQS